MASGSRTRMGHPFIYFLEATVAMGEHSPKTLCVPEQPQVGCRGLSTERTLSEGKQRVADPGECQTAGAITPFPKTRLSWGMA